MSDRDAFLRAILEQPGDDLPRLVYADYLDEHGECERAEFIRVQCELAVAAAYLDAVRPSYWTVADLKLHEHCNALRRRALELLEYGGWDWSGEARHLPGYPESVTYRRGLVAEITCSWPDWRTRAAAIRAATPLECVRLSTWPEVEARPPAGSRFSGRELDWLSNRVPPDAHFRLLRPGQADDPGPRWLIIDYDAHRGLIAAALATEYPGLDFELPSVEAYGFDWRRVRDAQARADFIHAGHPSGPLFTPGRDA